MHELSPADPRSLGPFRLAGRLGAGGMGVVYLGVDHGGQQVAVKTVPPGLGPDVRARLQREATLLRTIDHPRVARFVAADAGDEVPWLAMRYVPGPSLSQAAKPLPQHQLRQLADGLAEALVALHRLGVTHRDVKPGNIIMTSHGSVLVDLGIAVSADAVSMTMAGMTVGSPAWMAPEQFSGAPAGPAADVWGWAAVMSYAATGREPFGTGPVITLAHRIATQQPDLVGVPPWLLPPIRDAFIKDPSRRPFAVDLVRGGRARRPPTPPAPPALPSPMPRPSVATTVPRPVVPAQPPGPPGARGGQLGWLLLLAVLLAAAAIVLVVLVRTG